MRDPVLLGDLHRRGAAAETGAAPGHRLGADAIEIRSASPATRGVWIVHAGAGSDISARHALSHARRRSRDTWLERACADPF